MNFDEEVVRVYWSLMAIARHYYPHDEESAKDLASETVLKAIEARDRYDESRPMLAWCRVIMRNTYGMLMHKNRTIYRDDLDLIGGEQADQRTVVMQELTIISSLRRKYVSVDTLVRFSLGYSIAEIAKARNLSSGTVRRRVHDARIMLRRLII